MRHNLHNYPGFRPGSHSPRTTIALAVVLVITLIGAQILVSQRSAPLAAYDHAEELIKSVKTSGLSTYITAPSQTFYLRESDDTVEGFGIIGFTPEAGEDGMQKIVGRTVFYDLEQDVTRIAKFDISDDMRFYTYTQEIRGLNEVRALRLVEVYEDGALKIYTDRNFNQPIRAIEIRENYFIPEFLLDFFSSLALRESPYQDGVVFLMVNLPQFFSNDGDYFSKCVVMSGGKTTPEILQQYPGSKTAQVRWLGQSHKQIILYSEDHLLNWQKDFVGHNESILRAVSQDELYQTFPQAKQLLSGLKWLNDNEKNIQREEL